MRQPLPGPPRRPPDGVGNLNPRLLERQQSALHLVASRPQVGQGEFKKLVYDSTFRKRAEGMSFVNSKQEPGLSPKYHAGKPR